MKIGINKGKKFYILIKAADKLQMYTFIDDYNLLV